MDMYITRNGDSKKRRPYLAKYVYNDALEMKEKEKKDIWVTQTVQHPIRKGLFFPAQLERLTQSLTGDQKNIKI